MKAVLKMNLAAMFMVAVLMGAFMTTPAHAQSTEDDISSLVALVAQLQARLAELQAQFSAVTPGEAALNEVGSAVVTTSALRVRAEAGVTGAPLGFVPAGTQGMVSVVNEGPLNGYFWWKVEYENGLIGWSAANWLDVVDRSDAPDDGASGDDTTDDDSNAVSSAPTCDDFYFEPDTITRGEETDMIWKTSNANRVVLTVDSEDTDINYFANDDLAKEGSYEFKPLFSSETKLSVYSDVSPFLDTCTASLTVLDTDGEEAIPSGDGELPEFDEPATCELSFNPDSILRGGLTTMEWSSENGSRIVYTAESGELPDEGDDLDFFTNSDFPLEGSYDFRAIQTSTSKLTVYGEDPLNIGTCTATLTVSERS